LRQKQASTFDNGTYSDSEWGKAKKDGNREKKVLRLDVPRMQNNKVGGHGEGKRVTKEGDLRRVKSRKVSNMQGKISEGFPKPSRWEKALPLDS